LGHANSLVRVKAKKAKFLAEIFLIHGEDDQHAPSAFEVHRIEVHRMLTPLMLAA
jgi:hypothetical protein